MKLLRRVFVALVVCLAIASTPVAGQTPLPPMPSPTPASSLAITGPASIATYTLGQYVVTGDATAQVAWMVLPRALRPQYPDDDPGAKVPSQAVVGQTLVITGPPGLYTVIAFAVVSGQPVILQQIVSIAGPTPTPTPIPNPIPTPNPTPIPTPTPQPTTTGPYYIAFVTDASTPLTPAQAVLRISTTMQGSLKALAFGNQWSPSVDVSSPTFPYSAAARKAGLPCIVVVGTDAAGLGFVVEAIPNPRDEAYVLQEIQRLASGGAPR